MSNKNLCTSAFGACSNAVSTIFFNAILSRPIPPTQRANDFLLHICYSSLSVLIRAKCSLIRGRGTGMTRSPEMIARSQMPVLEYEVWTTFKQILWRLPEVNWNKNHLPPPTSSRSLKIARRRAEALNRLYEKDKAHEGHITWVTQNEIEFLPIPKAMARVIGAERYHVGGGEMAGR